MKYFCAMWGVLFGLIGCRLSFCLPYCIDFCVYRVHPNVELLRISFVPMVFQSACFWMPGQGVWIFLGLLCSMVYLYLRIYDEFIRYEFRGCTLFGLSVHNFVNNQIHV